MPALDMSLHELYQYQGRNPRPADIDTFWDASVMEMEALGTSCELVKSNFQVPNVTCYDMYYIGVEGARIHAKLVIPKADKPLPAVCHFHGYTGRAPDFSTMLNWAAAGFVIAAMDCRGQGGESEDVGGVKGNTHHGHIIRGLAEGNPKNLLFRHIFTRFGGCLSAGCISAVSKCCTITCFFHAGNNFFCGKRAVRIFHLHTVSQQVYAYCTYSFQL